LNITVKLFSALRDGFPDYDPETGLTLVLPEKASVADLVRHLGIPPEMAPVVACDGRILPKDGILADGGVFHLFQPVAGG
jgi:sulfur carrier protein ThiS